MAGDGVVGALRVEVDEAAAVRLGLRADLRLAAAVAAGEVLPGGDAARLQGGERPGQPLGVGPAGPGPLLGDPLQPQPVGQLLGLSRRHRVGAVAPQVVGGEFGRLLPGRVAAVQQAAHRLDQALLVLLGQFQRGGLRCGTEVHPLPLHAGVPVRVLARPADQQVGHPLQVRDPRLVVPGRAARPVLDGPLPAHRAGLHVHVRQVRHPLEHQERAVPRAHVLYQVDEFDLGDPHPDLVRLVLHRDIEHVRHPATRHCQRAAGVARERRSPPREGNPLPGRTCRAKRSTRRSSPGSGTPPGAPPSRWRAAAPGSRRSPAPSSSGCGTGSRTAG